MKLILFSGGVDSTTALAQVKKDYSEVMAVSFTYGQLHQTMELQAAKKIASYYNVLHRVIDLSSIFSASQSALSTTNSFEITKGDYKDQKEPNTEVEFRNGVFLSILASLAKQYGAQEIYFGAHLDDSGSVYPDASPEFVDAINQAISIGTSGQVTIKAPFMKWKKKDIVALGIELNVPYQFTYSCYQGTNPPCGRCGTCIDRQKAFNANGLELV